MHTLKESLEKCDTQLKQSDVREQAAECEAILQRTWEQRIGLYPLRIHQNIGKSYHSVLHMRKVILSTWCTGKQRRHFLLLQLLH